MKQPPPEPEIRRWRLEIHEHDAASQCWLVEWVINGVPSGNVWMLKEELRELYDVLAASSMHVILLNHTTVDLDLWDERNEKVS